jgi:glutamyl-Q tRNA(Asp) synthetase
LLGLPTPNYAHLPVAVDAAGAKLSKQTRAAPIDAHHPAPALFAALQFLGQNPPDELRRATNADFWAWSSAHWRLNRVTGVATQPVPPYAEEQTP